MKNSETFATKELYDIQLKATSNLEIAGKTFVTGETILFFDSLQLSTLTEEATRTTAIGGFGNSVLVSWKNTQAIDFVCEEGVLSKLSLAILSNSKLRDYTANQLIVPKTEILTADNIGALTLMNIPVSNDFFINNIITGDSVISYTKTGRAITGLTAYENYIVQYLFTYNNTATILTVGERLLNGYLALTAKMRIKDDTIGTNVTGILEIPHIRIMSDLSIQLGESVIPSVSRFSFQGDPVGERNSKYVCRITVLNTDIDTEKLL